MQHVRLQWTRLGVIIDLIYRFYYRKPEVQYGCNWLAEKQRIGSVSVMFSHKRVECICWTNRIGQFRLLVKQLQQYIFKWFFYDFLVTQFEMLWWSQRHTRNGSVFTSRIGFLILNDANLVLRFIFCLICRPEIFILINIDGTCWWSQIRRRIKNLARCKIEELDEAASARNETITAELAKGGYTVV